MPFGNWEIVVLIAWPAAWGVGCAVWERFCLAPRRLSEGVPPFLSAASVMVLLVGTYCLQHLRKGGTGHTLTDVVLIGSLFLFVGFLPAWLSFLGSRRLLRTRFADEHNT